MSKDTAINVPVLRSFGSDNHSGVHPKIMEALLLANQNHAPSYGMDPSTKALENKLKSIFGPESESYLVFNGTAANVLALKSVLKDFETVLASEESHLVNDECGAPAFFCGSAAITVKSTYGKMSLEDLKAKLIRRGDQHYSQIKAVSLTQPTELGTCYSLAEIKAITDWAHSEKLYVHMDGSRLANACRHLKVSFKQMTTDLGVDIVSLGGTKNGLLGVEIVSFLNPALNSDDFKFTRKQACQLPSKTRFLSEQFLAWFKNDLWQEIADHSMKQAQRLQAGLKSLSIDTLTEPQSNAVFAYLPKNKIKSLREKFFFYVWDETVKSSHAEPTVLCRLMCSWDTSDQDVDEFVSHIQRTTT